MYQTLNSTLKIKGMTLPNRIMMSAMGTELAEADGSCGEALLAYYEARARGGVGLVMLETTSVAWPRGASMPRMVGISERAHLPGLRDFVQRMQRHGARAGVQLNHSGKVATNDRSNGLPLLVPSIPHFDPSDMFESLTREEIASFVGGASAPVYQVMTQQDIDVLIGQFADAATLAVEAGFDCIEIHAGHGYALSSFLSPHYNQRDDGYGGSVEKRARLLQEVLRAVRERVGEDFPILCRLDANEFRVSDGIRPADALITAQLAVAAGCDAIDVSAYGNPTSGIAFTEAPIPHQPGAFSEFAAQIRRTVAVPVIAVGRIEPEQAERDIAAGRFDMVGMGRKLLADPELPNKLARNDPRRSVPASIATSASARSSRTAT
jgi:2,4-dienoyl-CoA reductase-like NADH-dependent reductase (Old Yellow Enzyme family)